MQRLLIHKKSDIKLAQTTEILDRTINLYGSIEKPLFLVKDVAEWIEHTNVTKMLYGVDNVEKVVIKLPTNHSLVGLQSNTDYTLTENGLYECRMLSRKPIAMCEAYHQSPTDGN